MRPTIIKFFMFCAVASLVSAAMYISLHYTQLDSEGLVILGTGGSDGAYDELTKTYEKELARNGIRLQVRSDLQGSDLLKALRDDKSGIDGGIMKGGFLGSMTGRLASAKARDRHETETANVVSLGRLFLEPIWVFTRGDLPVQSLRELEGKRVITGLRQAGARRVAMQMLRANGVNKENSTLVEKELSEDAKELLSNEADAAILILPPEADRIQKLLRVPNIRLMNFAPEAAAYTSRFPALTTVTMPRASVEFDPPIPSADITLIATSSALVVRRSTHPSIRSLLAHTVLHQPKSAFDKAGDPILFYRAGQFPSMDDPEYEVPQEVRQIYKSGEMPFLLRVVAPLNEKLGLPFSLTTFAASYGLQGAMLLIPVLTLLWPITKAVPAVYRWTIRRRLLYWYRELKEVERQVEHADDYAEISATLAELERVDKRVARIRVPLEFSDQFYDLRGHIDLVRQLLTQRMANVMPPVVEKTVVTPVMAAPVPAQ